MGVIEALIGVIGALLVALGGMGFHQSRTAAQRKAAEAEVHKLQREVEAVAQTREIEQRVRTAGAEARERAREHRREQPQHFSTRPTGDFGDSRLHNAPTDSCSSSSSVSGSSSSSSSDC